MSPVGGSRHYQGAGLGQIGIWGCPGCGEDNEGPIERGCVHCGAGKPAATPLPRVSDRAPDDPTYAPPPELPSKLLMTEPENEFTGFLKRHPGATLEQAFIAGYVEGVRAARRAEIAARPPQPPPAPDALTTTADAKTYRTVVAALALFRDQILSGDPEEVTTGEWMSADETSNVIQQLQEQLNG